MPKLATIKPRGLQPFIALIIVILTGNSNYKLLIKIFNRRVSYVKKIMHSECKLIMLYKLHVSLSNCIACFRDLKKYKNLLKN